MPTFYFDINDGTDLVHDDEGRELKNRSEARASAMEVSRGTRSPTAMTGHSAAWLEVRKRAGLEIDPATAEVTWTYGQTLNPYGIIVDLPDEYSQVGREYFARSPGSDIWVNFHDLPNATVEALRGKHMSKLAFPAGFEDCPF
jgi:hypothetical protein